jgi:hypothetical protein
LRLGVTNVRQLLRQFACHLGQVIPPEMAVL